MPSKKKPTTSLTLAVGGLTEEVRSMKRDLNDHVAEEHGWLHKIDAVTTRLEHLDSIKVNGNVGLEKGLQDIYKKTDGVSTQVTDLAGQVSELAIALQPMLRRKRVIDDLTKWMEHSAVTGFLFSKWAKSVLLLLLGAAIVKHEEVAAFIKSLF